jgi:hypothetical protein
MGASKTGEAQGRVYYALTGAVIQALRFRGFFANLRRGKSAVVEGICKQIGATPWFELTQDRIQQCAEATEDRQCIHVDQERARLESPYGAAIAHGFLTLSLTSYFAKQAVEIRKRVRQLRAESCEFSRTCACQFKHSCSG